MSDRRRLLARLFIALDLPGDARQALESIQPWGVPGVRLVAPDQLHLTLHFLGNIDETVGQNLPAVLAEVPSPPLTLVLSGVGQFPEKGPAQILWAGVAENPELRQLRREIEARLSAAIGSRGESRPWRPHITLARVTSSRLSGPIRDWLSRQSLFQLAPVVIERWGLYRSDLGPTGPCYSMILSRRCG